MDSAIELLSMAQALPLEGAILNSQAGVKCAYFLERPREHVIINPPFNGPSPMLFPLPSVQSNSGSMSLFATLNRA